MTEEVLAFLRKVAGWKTTDEFVNDDDDDNGEDAEALDTVITEARSLIASLDTNTTEAP